jgi:HD-like signal output (HDOD) protein
VELIRLIDDQNTGQGDVARLVESDPGLAAETLTTANSSLFGFQSRIETIPHAISLLGNERIRRLGTSIVLKSYLRGLMTSPVAQRLWAHSVACGVIAAEIAPRVWAERDRAYTAGLLHDLGRVAMIAACPTELCALLDLPYESQREVLVAEQKTLGLDHCEAGWWLARAWALPEQLWEISRGHHDGLHASIDLLGLVSLSCRLADSLGFAVVRYERQESPEELLSGCPSYQSAILATDFRDLTNRVESSLKILG